MESPSCLEAGSGLSSRSQVPILGPKGASILLDIIFDVVTDGIGIDENVLEELSLSPDEIELEGKTDDNFLIIIEL